MCPQKKQRALATRMKSPAIKSAYKRIGKVRKTNNPRARAK